jgi:hypothetical protein
MTRVYRAAVSTYVIFAVMFVPFIVALLFRWRDPGARRIFVMIAVAAVFCVTWVARFRIVITEHSVDFRSLFTSSAVPRAAIRSARVTFRASARSRRKKMIDKRRGRAYLLRVNVIMS